MSALMVGSLFSGYGGLDLAVCEVFGAEMAWHVEIEPGPAAILAAHWPDVPNLGDVSTVDWATVEPVDILTGGFPCQDISSAGRQAGMGAGTRSGLWSVMCDAVNELRPRYVVIENVRALLSTKANRNEGTGTLESDADAVGDRADGPVLRALGAVLGDLTDIGYDARWTTLRASVIGAPHHRERVFILAEPADAEGVSRGILNRDRREAAADADGNGRGEGPGQPGAGEPQEPTSIGGVAVLRPDEVVGTASPMLRDALTFTDGGHAYGDRAVLPTPSAADGNGGGRYNAHGHQSTLPGTVRGLAVLPTLTASDVKRGDCQSEAARRTPSITAVSNYFPTPSASDSTGGGMDPDKVRSGGHHVAIIDAALDVDLWGKYGPAIRRWEALTRPAPAPTEPNSNGNPRLSAAFAEWMMGLPDGWVTGHGLPRTVELKAIGNGVVPQQAAAALRSLLDWQASA